MEVRLTDEAQRLADELGMTLNEQAEWDFGWERRRDGRPGGSIRWNFRPVYVSTSECQLLAKRRNNDSK